MGYDHDIFVSYKRDPETLFWLREHFVPLLRLRVGLELGREVNVYVHEITHNIPAGATWPSELGQTLARSRIVVALWTKNYFNSLWCTEEMSRMLAREKEAGKRNGLVVPVVIHDGEDFPSKLGLIQKIELQQVYNTRMRRDSAKAEELSDLINKHAPSFAKAIHNAPSWRKKWPEETAKKFLQKYYRAERPSQRVLPRFNAR